MNVYLDDDVAKKALAARLQKAGHHVVLPSTAGTSGISDPRHLLQAVQKRLVLLTKNHDDFEDLHQLIQGLKASTLALSRSASTTIRLET